ncbi:hypothetical protein AKJ09_04847 [Labilithrix luteola]|uniref:Uncharacterized protein n=1 Tax=Labilithrix luteola TaxID=1391654 RepID=A0A0K1PXD5_9BACT|nr:hypothetical protein AKJ09_04847 [Labilithrix luteola]
MALDYVAPPDCPTETAFVGSVKERLGDRPVSAIDGRQVRIRVTADGSTYRGALETVAPPSVRDVTGASCNEVARALVVFTALALSPPDGVEPPAPPPAPVEDPPPTPPPSSFAPERPAPPRPKEKGRSRLGIGLDLRAVAASGVAPGVSPGGAVSARVVLFERRSLRWLAQVGGVITYREEPVDDGGFSFLWTAGRVDTGPEFSLAGFRLSGGPVFRVGALIVNARDLPASVSYSGFWGDVGAFARLGRPLSSAVEFSFVFELAAPLRRKSFGIQGVEAPVHEVPQIVATGSFGITFGP